MNLKTPSSGPSTMMLAAILTVLTAGSAPWWWPTSAVAEMPSSEPGKPLGPRESVDALLYTAELGCRDHFNSNAQPLLEAVMIVRQDRANYYSLGARDPGDTSDKVFASKSAREDLERLLQLTPEQSRIILTRTPTIQVYGGATGYHLNVVNDGAPQAHCP